MKYENCNAFLNVTLLSDSNHFMCLQKEQQLMREKEQLVREKEELQAANTRGQEEVQQLRQQVSDSDIIVQWSLSYSSAVSREHC